MPSMTWNSPCAGIVLVSANPAVAYRTRYSDSVRSRPVRFSSYRAKSSNIISSGVSFSGEHSAIRQIWIQFRWSRYSLR